MKLSYVSIGDSNPKMAYDKGKLHRLI
jgi:hypothetical protein